MSDVEDHEVVLPSLRAALVDAAAEQERRRDRRVRRARRLLSLGAAVAAAAVVIVVLASVLAPDQATAGVSVRRDGDHWVVTVRDAAVAYTDVAAELERHGIAVVLKPAPAGPSRVGEFIISSEEVQAVGRDRASSQEIRIPVDVPYIHLRFGRRAAPSEGYDVFSDAYAEGEPLECSGLYGTPIAEAIPEIERRFHGTIDYRGKDGRVVAEPPPSGFVTDVAMLSANRMSVLVNDDPHSPFLQSPTLGSARCPVSSER